MNTLKPEELHTVFKNAASMRASFDNDTPLKFTQDFMSVNATPAGTYLRPNYPYKVKHNDSMARTMDGAWRRFEDQLKMEEALKRRQAAQF